MKPYTLAIAVSLALGSYASPATAVEPGMWGSVSTMTVALTLSYTVEGTVMKDETGKIIPANNGGGPAFTNMYSAVTTNKDGIETKRVDTMEYAAKAVTYKYGNVEILKELVAADVLPLKGKSPFIAGWSIVVVTDLTGIKSVYARHTDKTAVLLEGITFDPMTPVGPIGETFMGAAVTSNNKDVTTTVTNPTTGDSTITRTLTDSTSYRSNGSGTVSESLALFLGLYTETGSKTIIKVETIDGDKFYTDVFVPGATKLDKIVGTETDDGSGNAALIEGTMSTSAGVVTDLNLYLPAL